MRYGFVIDQRKCIGCHACTVACKEENGVPLGAFRTWVKYVERGSFPDTRRYFAVLRCNHCDNAPCVTICPTTALYRRDDGIVDFDRDRCIGCKSCMQACPYDALYIDPATNTAAKCHYCAHRTEVGLEPACVIVCPEQAIVSGDLDAPESKIARLIATSPVQVRKAEQGTRPKVFYLGADTAALTPSLQAPSERYLWAERQPAEVDLMRLVAAAQEQGNGHGTLSRTVYDVPRAPRAWGWRVSTYLWTKSIAAGALLVAAAGFMLGEAEGGRLSGIAAPALALLFLAITSALLVFDLKRPDRFYYLLVKGNPRSWLVLGTWILLAYGAVTAWWLFAGLTGGEETVEFLALPALLLGAAAAGYSAFLFGQAEGRDFWQSPLLLPHLLAAAVVAGAATLVVAQSAIVGSLDVGATGADPLAWVMTLGLLAHGGLLALDLFGAHQHVDATRAARVLTHGWPGRFWGGIIAGGIVLPLALTWTTPFGAVPAAVLALAGLWLYEDLWIQAGQAIPLS